VQDPIPAVNHPLIGEQDIAALKAKILASGLSVSSWSRRLGRPRRRSAALISAVERTARAFASRRKRTGRSTSRLNSPRCSRSSKLSRRSSMLPNLERSLERSLAGRRSLWLT